MTDAPEQTPLVRRINSRHAVQCRLLENVRGGYGYTGTCNCGAAEDADEVAALEQDRRDLLERLGIAWARSKTENEELARLRKAIRERDEWLDQIRSCLFQPGPLLAHTTLLIAQGIVRAAIDARATAEGKNDG